MQSSTRKQQRATSKASSSKRIRSRAADNEPTSDAAANHDQGWLAKLQTPEMLDYMQYFVLLNSLVILLFMGIPKMQEFWNEM